MFVTTDELASTTLTTASAALINLGFIFGLDYVWGSVAEKLTDMEMPRTQTAYDNSLTLKIFLLKFVNTYASVFYIGTFRGK